LLLRRALWSAANAVSVQIKRRNVSEEKRKFDLYDRTHKSRSDLQRRCRPNKAKSKRNEDGAGAGVAKSTEALSNAHILSGGSFLFRESIPISIHIHLPADVASKCSFIIFTRFSVTRWKWDLEGLLTGGNL